MIEVAQEVSPLRAHALGKRHGGRAVLQDASLRVETGSIVGLVGRNGAGKSTLIECLLGLQSADSGQALVFGKDPRRLTDLDKAMLGYVAQRPDGFDWMAIGAMLDFIAQLYPQWDNGLVQRLLAQWHLDPRQRMATLSPGQRQQVAIIRAIAPHPPLVVLDEPASALDPLARRALLREIVNLAGDDGCTVLFSTHIISDLERIATHIAVLHDGAIPLHAAVDDIKDTVRRVHWPASVPLPAAALAGELSRRPSTDGGCTLVLRGPAHGALPQGVLPKGVQSHPVGLEDLFVELTA